MVVYSNHYGVATISRFLGNIGFFCKRDLYFDYTYIYIYIYAHTHVHTVPTKTGALLQKVSSAKETSISESMYVYIFIYLHQL